MELPPPPSIEQQLKEKELDRADSPPPLLPDVPPQSRQAGNIPDLSGLMQGMPELSGLMGMMQNSNGLDLSGLMGMMQPEGKAPEMKMLFNMMQSLSQPPRAPVVDEDAEFLGVMDDLLERTIPEPPIVPLAKAPVAKPVAKPVVKPVVKPEAKVYVPTSMWPASLIAHYLPLKGITEQLPWLFALVALAIAFLVYVLQVLF